MSVGPARIAGLAEHGRPVAAGEPANLVLVDPAATVTVDRDASQSLSRNTPWHGRTLTGAVHTTILRGHRVRARRGAHRMLTTREPAVLVLEDGRTFTGRAYGHRGTHGRRGGLLHRHDRLPGDPHRPELPPPGRRHDGAARRQHRAGTTRTTSRAASGSPATSCATPPCARRAGARGAPSRTSSTPRASSASATSTPARSPGTCASAAPCASASSPGTPRARRASSSSPGSSTRRRWRARRWPSRSRPTRPTSCRRWGRGASPWPRSTSASRR